MHRFLLPSIQHIRGITTPTWSQLQQNVSWKKIKKRVPQFKSLAERHPAIAGQWHPTRNGNVTPDMVLSGYFLHVFSRVRSRYLILSTGSNKKYWFKCQAGPDHEWEAPVGNTTYNKNGCPCCSGRKLSVTNSLATRYPAVAAQWHPTLNGDVTPDAVIAGFIICE
jgi:hypothetical protein